MDIGGSVWFITCAVILGLFVFDFYAHVRVPHEPTFKESAIWSSVYIGLAVAFGFVVWWLWGGTFAGEYFAGYVTEKALSVDNLFVFTVIMGNGFAAFPVMTGGVGVPVLVGVYHGDPAVMAAVGMLSGYCGTLLTPMAANFNLVPAALLEIDKNAVIRAQVPTAVVLLTCNVFLLNFLMFR